VVETLTRDDFFRENHIDIFDAICALNKEQRNVDIVTVSDELRRRKRLSAAGGSAYVAELASIVPSTANAAQYARIIRDKAMLRRLIKTSSTIETAAYDGSDEADDILADAEKHILEIAQRTQTSEASNVADIIEDALKDTKAHLDSGKKLLGITTGLTDLDAITSGLQSQDLIVLAARPSMGKTALALCIALNAALSEDKAKVLIFSIEMGKKSLGQRMLSILSRVNLKNIKDGKVFNNGDELDRVNEATEKLRNADIYIDESSGTSVNEMKNKCRRMKQKMGLDLVVIDYLQLMSLSGSDRPESRVLEIASISRQLKLMARDLKCPVLLLSQMSRLSERRTGNPMLSDLRDSGAIEQDGDLIMFIHNMSDEEQERYNKSGEGRDDFTEYDNQNMRQLLILKHRNGETGEVRLSWRGSCTRFGNLAFGSMYNDLNPTRAAGGSTGGGYRPGAGTPPGGGYLDDEDRMDEDGFDEGFDPPIKNLPY
jgi:replicative DNA helicase